MTHFPSKYGLLFALSGLFLFLSCNFNKSDKKNAESSTSISQNILEKQNNSRSKAFVLSKEAMETISHSIPPSIAEDTVNILHAIDILDSAISLDSKFYSAHTNKATLLSHIGKYNLAIHVLDDITEIEANYAEGFLLKGILYERQEKIDSANIAYKGALVAFDNRIKETDKIEDKVNKAFVLFLIDNQEGKNEINKLIKIYPNNELIKFWKKKLFDSFDREAFINNQ